MRRFLFLTLAFLIPAAAHSGPGWGWEEIDSREWRPETLDWAAEIDQDQHTQVWIQDMIEPPPREMWCLEDSEVHDTEENCEIYFQLLDTWIAEYLELGDNEPIPENALAFPNECLSSCFVE